MYSRMILISLFFLIILVACEQRDSYTSDDATTTTVANLSMGAADTLISEMGFYDALSNSDGTGIENNFEAQSSGMVIVDNATNLTWQQGGSGWVDYDGAMAYVAGLNSENFAGYDNWRLPTLQEAMGLMEATTADDLHIDSAFGSEQWCVWTSDAHFGSSNWTVSYRHGFPSYFPKDADGASTGTSYTRAVR